MCRAPSALLQHRWVRSFLHINSVIHACVPPLRLISHPCSCIGSFPTSITHCVHPMPSDKIGRCTISFATDLPLFFFILPSLSLAPVSSSPLAFLLHQYIKHFEMSQTVALGPIPLDKYSYALSNENVRHHIWSHDTRRELLQLKVVRVGSRIGLEDGGLQILVVAGNECLVR